MFQLRIRNILVYAAIVLLGGWLLWMAEKETRRFPQLMLPSWQIRYYMNHETKPKLVPDAEIGFLIAPNQQEVIQTPDYTSVRVTDSKGFPNTDPWPNQADIVFLGDSLIVGEGVGLASSFPQLIAKMLPNLKFVNLGLAGAGAERQYPIFRRFGAGLHPRLVVACLYLAADFDNDLHFDAWLREGKQNDYDSFRLGYGRSHETSWKYGPSRLFERSWVLGMLREIVLRWLPGANHFPDRHRFPDGNEVLLYKPTVDFAAEAVVTENDGRIDALLDSLKRLRDFVTREDGKLLVALIPSKEELFAVNATVRAHTIVSHTRQRLEEAQFSVLDFYPAIEDGGASRSPYFRLDIHLNEYGNRILAEQFVGWFHNHAQEISE
jgi:hypothetical protein